MRPKCAVLIATVLVLVLIIPVPVQALPAGPGPAPPPPGDEALVDQLQQATSDGIRVSYHAQTGKVRFIGADRGHSVPRPEGAQADADPEQVARSFLDIYGRLFGLRDQARELAVLRSKTVDGDRSFVRFQQVYGGIPVVGGELVIQLDAARNVLSASGEVLPDLELDVAPTIDVDTARQTATRVVMKSYEVEKDSLTVTEPELWIYNPVLLNPGPNISGLVWLMEVQSEQLLPIRELVLVDAHHGFVALHFNQIATAKNRITYDNNNDPFAGLPGYGPARTEGQGSTGVSDIDQAYDYGGDTYDFYYNYHGRDSLDNAGMSLVSTTRYCSSPSYCPYSNAFWNGMQMVYGQGWAVDDVVAHEMTHGVTDYESNLYYYYQSGAINEAFSDIWGEFVDLTNGAGNDDPGVRWLTGEDLAMGPIRDMANPPSHGDPDKISSPNYYCGEGDSGGVHTNSGIANKTAYLLVDGDTFNGYTISPIGLTKTAKIFYEVQTNWLTSASDYNDLYDDLYYACTNLIGTAGITSSDCDEVNTALTATETYLPEPCDTRDEAPVCDTGQPSYLFFDDFEDGMSNWATGASVGSDEWWYATFYAVSGNASLWGWDDDYLGDYYAAMIDDVALPQGMPAYMHFAHSHQFEDWDYEYWRPNWDGGVVEYSTDGGTSWYETGGLFDHTGYNGTIYETTSWWANPLHGRQAFVGESNGYYSSRLDLSPLAGQDVRFRFRIGTDAWVSARGWFIDDVGIYACDLTRVYIPLALKSYSGGAPPPPPGIYGTVTQDGSPAAGVPLDLRFYDGWNWDTVLRTTTAADGSYRFVGLATLAPLQRYFVYYRNREATPGRLWSWATPHITSYTAGTNLHAGDFDIADIALVSPPDGDTVSLPYTFSWNPRPATPSDSYYLDIYDPWNEIWWSTPDLGYLGSYELHSLPSGFTTGKGYIWDVGVDTPGSGGGWSYREGHVSFSNYGSSPPESETANQNTPPEGFHPPERQRP